MRSKEMKKKIRVIVCILIMAITFSFEVSAEGGGIPTYEENNISDSSVRTELWANILTTRGKIKVPVNTYIPGASAYYVRLMQCCLNYIYPKLNLATDGAYGVNTQSAIMKFQRDESITEDGVAGYTTWFKLNSKVANNGWTIPF